MNKIKNFYLLFFCLVFFSGCIEQDPLAGIRRLSRKASNLDKKKDIEFKKEAAKTYKKAIDVMVDSYKANGSLNKDIGEKLMFIGDYKDAVKHLMIAKDIRNEDANVYFWLGVCYVNLYKIENNFDYVLLAKDYYETALRLSPNYMDLLYSYAHLLVYGIKDYEKAKEVLNYYIYDAKNIKPDKNKNNQIIGKPDPKAYFLLAGLYFRDEDYNNAYDTYNKIYKFENILTNEEKEKLKIHIDDTVRKINEK